jgi:hypothetical protein
LGILGIELCSYPVCENRLGKNNKSGFCSNHAYYTDAQQAKYKSYQAKKKNRNLQIALAEAEKRGKCAYRDLPLPGKLTCPINFDREEYHIGWEWDHLPEFTKEGGIAEFVFNASAERLETELAKCVLTCGYHHNLITAARRRDV